MTTLRDVALMRLVAQRVAGPPMPGPAGAVRHLLAVQGQDLPGALLSVALRTRTGTRPAVETALDAGDVVRSWPMRGTLHLVAAEDLRWLRELCAPRVLTTLATRRKALGLPDADAERAGEVASAALSGGRRLGRTALAQALEGAGVPTDGQRGYHLIGFLAHTGLLCLGPTDGAGEQQFVLAEEWLPPARPRDRDEALAELALRYFSGHGPATVADLVRWSGLRVTDVRTGVAAVRDRLATVGVDGTEFLLDPGTPDLLAEHRELAAGLHLLPGFDEFVLGYADRSCAVPPEHAERIVPGGNGMFRATVVVGGQVVGTWRWGRRGRVRTVDAEPFTAFAPEVAAALGEAGPAVAARAEPARTAPGGTRATAGGG